MAALFQAAGTAASSTTTISPAWPTHAIGDIALLFVESCGGEPVTLSTPAGFAAVPNSPQATGSGTAGTQLSVFWCRATSTTMGAPTVADPGNHVLGIIVTFRGCAPSGNPWIATGGNVKATASTTVTVTGINAQIPGLVVQAASRDNDATGAHFSTSYANAALSGLAVRYDDGTTSGNGGGIGIWTGTLAAAGSTGDLTANIATAGPTPVSSTDAFMTIVLIAPAYRTVTPVTMALSSLSAPRTATPVTLAVAKGRTATPITMALAKQAIATPITITLVGQRTGTPVTIALTTAVQPRQARVSWIDFHVPLSGTITRTATPVMLALQSTRIQTATPITAALQATRPQVATPVTIALQATRTQTATPLTAALQASRTQIVTPVTAALQSTRTQTATPIVAALQATRTQTGTPVTLTISGAQPRIATPITITLAGGHTCVGTPITIALSASSLAHTATPVTMALQLPNAVRTGTPVSIALQLTRTQVVTPITLALQSTFGRTANPVTTTLMVVRRARVSWIDLAVPAASPAVTTTLTATPVTAALQATLAHVATPVTMALQLTIVTTTLTATPVTAALQATRTRTATPITLALSGAQATGDIVVNGSVPYKVIDGLGWQLTTWAGVYSDIQPVLDSMASDGGGSLFAVDPCGFTQWVPAESDVLSNPYDFAANTRLRQVYEGTFAGDYSGAWTTTSGGNSSNGINFSARFPPFWKTLHHLYTRGKQVILTCQGGAPAWAGGPAFITQSKETSFARMIVSMIHYGRSVRGFPIALLSIMNETDWSINGLEGPEVDGTQYNRILGLVRSELDSLGYTDVLFVAPQTANAINSNGANGGTALAPAIDADANNQPRIRAWARHTYGVNLSSDVSLANSYHAHPLWATEFNGSDLENGLETGDQWGYGYYRTMDLLNNIIGPGATAGIIWEALDNITHKGNWTYMGDWGYSNAPNPTPGGTYSPKPRYTQTALWYAAIPAGWRRIGCSTSNGNLDVEAFSNGSGGVSIIGYNNSGSSQSVTVAINNTPTPATIYHRETTATADRVTRATIAGGQTFSATISGNAFFVLTSIPLPHEHTHAGTPVTITLTGGGSRAATPVTIALSAANLARTGTPVTLALSGGATHVATPITMALSAPNLVRTGTPLSAVLQSLGLVRSATPITVALQGAPSRTATPITIALQSSGLTRTGTPLTAALQLTRIQTATPVTSALLGTFTKTATPITAPLLATRTQLATPITTVLQALNLSRAAQPTTIALVGGVMQQRLATPIAVALQTPNVVRTGTPVAVTLARQRSATPITVPLRGTIGHTATPVTLALRATWTLVATPVTAALQSTRTQTATPITLALNWAGQTRSATPITMALRGTLIHAATPTTFALQTPNVVRTGTPVTLALLTVGTRTATPITTPLQASPTRTATPVTLVLQGNPSRTATPIRIALQTLGAVRPATPVVLALQTLGTRIASPVVIAIVMPTLVGVLAAQVAPPRMLGKGGGLLTGMRLEVSVAVYGQLAASVRVRGGLQAHAQVRPGLQARARLPEKGDG